MCLVELGGGCTRRAFLAAPTRARHRLTFAQRHRARSIGDASRSPEESLFRDCLTVCRIPEDLMVDFRRCTMGTTAELMTVAGGALEMKPLPEGALEAALVSLAHPNGALPPALLKNKHNIIPCLQGWHCCVQCAGMTSTRHAHE